MESTYIKIMKVAGMVMSTIIEEVDTLEELMTIIMTTLDEWAKAHEVSPKELEEILEKSVEIMKNCHEEMGW